MLSEDKDGLIKAQNEVIGILFEIVKRLQANIDLQEEGVQIIIKSKDESNLKDNKKRLNEISRANSVLFTLDVSQVTQEKIAVITVGDTTVFNERDLKRLNRSFRSEFSDITDFKLKDEALIEGIIDSYKRSAKRFCYV